MAFVSAAVNGWHSQQDASAKDLIFGGVLIFGIDSPLGRVYFVYGQTEGQRSRMHLQLNRIFCPAFSRSHSRPPDLPTRPA